MYMPFAPLVISVSLWCVSGSQPASSPFILETSDRDSATGSLVELSEDWSVRLNGREEVRAAGRDVVSLRQVGAVLPPIPARNFVVLVNGDVIPFNGIRLIGERFVLNPPIGNTKEIRLNPSQVALVWFSAPDAERHPDKLRRTLAAGQRTRDRILLRNGDTLEGTITGMDEKVVRTEVDKRNQELPISKMAIIAMNTELASRRKPKGSYGRLVLANGGRLSLSSATADGETLSGKLTSGIPIHVNVRDLVSLSIFQGCAEYLSDMKPSKVEQTPYLDSTLAPVLDGTAKDRDLRVGGGRYDKGIGMHGACRMTFDLRGAFKRIESLVALDDVTGREGRARVEVLVDGKAQQLGLERDLTHRNGPLTVRVDVTGAKQLTLVVDFGERGDVQADVNWVDARLIKK
jgi:hypothetical protein